MLPLKTGAEIRHSQYQEVKQRVHEQLLGRLNLERLSQVRRTEAEPEIRSVIASLLEKEAEKTPLSLYEREAIIVDGLNELFGLGPLEALLVDPDVSDILVNTQNFARLLEEQVRRYPEQWLWVHRRWKTRPPGEPPLYP